LIGKSPEITIYSVVIPKLPLKIPQKSQLFRGNQIQHLFPTTAKKIQKYRNNPENPKNSSKISEIPSTILIIPSYLQTKPSQYQSFEILFIFCDFLLGNTPKLLFQSYNRF
jgi:hypothetical protein